jgi:hypothetical protein
MAGMIRSVENSIDLIGNPSSYSPISEASVLLNGVLYFY